MTEREQAPPKTFREAEVLGLKFMQDGQYEQALDGELKLLQKWYWYYQCT